MILALTMGLFIRLSAQNVSQQSIPILTLNTWALPIKLPGTQSTARYQMIVDSLAQSETPIICLQECFHKELRSKIATVLGPKFHFSNTILHQRKVLGLLSLDTQGGLVTLSKYPILRESYIPFGGHPQENIEEKIGRKGFLVSLVYFKNQMIAIINTHLYAGQCQLSEQIRLTQIKKIMEYINQDPSLLGLPVILAGDLNIAHPQVAGENPLVSKSLVYDHLYDFGFFDTAAHLGKNDYSVAPHINKYASKTPGKQKLDYVFYKLPDWMKGKASSKGIRFVSPQPLSDHMAWSCELQIEPWGQKGEPLVQKTKESEQNSPLFVEKFDKKSLK